ncbi:UDP-N-acetylmuramyl pentapeptide phosphotransferase/UDP-N-acetylglucosamine-1-phosphate transferase [Arthrobacter stackebrandtii]|uniref:UDP-N-acetylmuramyl pentapeptide phosphotransferase/UDP-N-acetylglucosamine-1-phosphate transferase n=1 Tax=Arthrobacter stackebrandtii TaxID=272161 RepID=A0ABS4YYK9_9MICC|nr:glycosyltransferase family 4 protein [Arthrobacter stackebrandtii]MBP2413887.1 UDP-N-acetylmuramyl pentapeptide phosphotransferase/UDP-N-acetylglucosamine-1-phosphate transferase [Arthrobacter stackebrandtii]
MELWAQITVGAIALVLALVLPLFVRPLLARAGVLDVPNARSSHTTPTIRGMGITTAAALAAAVLAAVFLPQTGNVTKGSLTLVVILGVVLAAAAIGWIEDIRGLSVKVRASLQLGVGAVATAVVALIDPGQQQLWLIPVGALAVAAYINVANFMDGINGISGSHGLLVGGFYAYAGIMSGHAWLVYAGIAIAMAFAGFLPWNLSRNKVFLGDVGSYLLGASIAVTAMCAFLAGVPVEYIFSPVLIYLIDTFVTFLRRLIAGERWYAAHRQHVYQRLTIVGLSHLQATAVVCAATVLVSVLGIVAAQGSEAVQVVATAAGFAVVLAYLRTPTWFQGWMRRHRAESANPAESGGDSGAAAREG